MVEKEIIAEERKILADIYIGNFLLKLIDVNLYQGHFA